MKKDGGNPQHSKEMIAVEELIEKWGFQREMLEYLQKKGLDITEMKTKGMHHPIKVVRLSALAKFLYTYYDLHLLEKVKIPLAELLNAGSTQRGSEIPSQWTKEQMAEFLRVQPGEVRDWIEEGKLKAPGGKIPISSVAEFTGVTEEEIKKSWPQLYLRDELEKMGIPTNHQGYTWGKMVESISHQPPQVLVRNPGEVYFLADAPVRYSRWYVADYVVQQLGAVKWIPFLKMYYQKMKKYFARKEREEVAKKVRLDFFGAMKLVEEYLIQQVGESVRKLDRERVMRILGLLEEFRALFPKAPRAVEKPVPKPVSVKQAVAVAEKKRPPRKRVDVYAGQGLRPSEWIIRNQGIVRLLKHPSGKTYEQRISFTDLRKLVDALKPLAPPNDTIFRTSDWLKSVNWDKKQRYKLNVAAVVLESKGALKISGKIRSSTYQVAFSPEELDRIVKEITGSPEA